MCTQLLEICLLDTIPSFFSCEYWKSVIQNGLGCTAGSFLAIFFSYLIYVGSIRKDEQAQKKSHQQQTKDVLIYFQSLVKNVISTLKIQIAKLEEYIAQTNSDSLNIGPLTYLPLFQLTRIAEGDSIDRILAAYIERFPGEESVKEFSEIVAIVEYFYGQLLQLPEEIKRALNYDFESKTKYQTLFQQCYGLLGRYMLDKDPTHPTPGSATLALVMQDFKDNYTDNYDLAHFYKYFFIPVNRALYQLLNGIEDDPIFVELIHLTRDGRQLFEYIQNQNLEFAKSLEILLPKMKTELELLQSKSEKILSFH